MDSFLPNQGILSIDSISQDYSIFGDKNLTIVSLMNAIKKDSHLRSHYVRCILIFDELWKKKRIDTPGEILNDGYCRVWGSRIVYPENTSLGEIFTDKLLSNVIQFFSENQVRVVSEITEEVLKSLLFHNNVGYMKFAATIDVLFGDVEKTTALSETNHMTEGEESSSGDYTLVNPANKAEDEFKKINSQDGNLSPGYLERTTIDSLGDESSIDNSQVDPFKPEEINKFIDHTIQLASTLQEEIVKYHESLIKLKIFFTATNKKIAEQNQEIQILKNNGLILQETIEKRDKSLVELREEYEDKLKSKDQEIYDRNSALALKDQYLADKDILLRQRLSELENKTQELDAANQELVAKTTLLFDNKTELEKITSELDCVNHELAAKAIILAEKEAELQAATQELEILHKEKTAAKLSFLEIKKVKESMQNMIRLLRGDRDEKM